MLKYGKNSKQFNPIKLDDLNIDKQSLSYVPAGSRVLEIGCATGFMGKYLKREKKCYVIGVDSGNDEITKAGKELDSVVHGDIEDIQVLNKISGKFDVLLASAIIEHLRYPSKSLVNWKKFLKKDGFLLITTSNIAHWSMRSKIMRGKFDYEEYGIMDNTHLHFYTMSSFKNLLEDNGYAVEKFLIDPVGGGFPKISKLLARFFPGLFAYQMIIKATVKK